MSNTKKQDGTPEKTSLIENQEEQKDDRPVCGLIMPIADTEGYPAGHWEELKRLYISVGEDAGFRTRLVSDSDDVRIIQKNIVQNVFDDDIVICDVSSKNPNVMFELGLRLAFDKAAVIVKDNITGYSFDTSPIAHINYPKDLRYYDIEDFKIELKSKLSATYTESKKTNHSMYLDSFGKFIVKGIQTQEITDSQFVLESLRDIKNELRGLRSSKNNNLVNNKFRNSSPNIKANSDYLNDMFENYLNNKREGGQISPGDFYRYVSDLADLLGDEIPSQQSTYDFFKSKISLDKLT
ncbi:hypothetical protein [Chryseobacterium gwangjuense]|uniref:hypothetical protein n=1 Tax=Chryseobacterium gwangjuense TaxID=1069980 RepID=UPI001E501A1D|nr:hypothetical protein [Chryseobacterium gwangjuense]MCE3076741.1 hypothetical protein [Chryseobacterium gwangjuense]